MINCYPSTDGTDLCTISSQIQASIQIMTKSQIMGWSLIKTSKKNIKEEWNYLCFKWLKVKFNIMSISTALVPTVQHSHVILTTLLLSLPLFNIKGISHSIIISSHISFPLFLQLVLTLALPVYFKLKAYQDKETLSCWNTFMWNVCAGSWCAEFHWL